MHLGSGSSDCNHLDTSVSDKVITLHDYLTPRLTPRIKKPLPKVGRGEKSTQSRGRTGTILQSLVFETNASTNSATWALFSNISLAHLQNCFKRCCGIGEFRLSAEVF